MYSAQSNPLLVPPPSSIISPLALLKGQPSIFIQAEGTVFWPQVMSAAVVGPQVANAAVIGLQVANASMVCLTEGGLSSVSDSGSSFSRLPQVAFVVPQVADPAVSPQVADCFSKCCGDWATGGEYCSGLAEGSSSCISASGGWSPRSAASGVCDAAGG